MTDYHRATRACALDQLQPELARAIRDHLEAQHLSDLLDEVLMCCETTSDQSGPSWLDALLGGKPDTTVSYLALVVTPRRLIWARRDDQSAATVASAPLSDLFIKVLRPRNTRDFGLQMDVRMAGTRRYVSGQLLLGPEPAAEEFCVALGEAMRIPIMKPPAESWWSRLWGN